jgi:4-amino-4-deoxy-L-arabinose transferase-like glycosyltransferase
MHSLRFLLILLALAVFTAFYDLGRRDVVDDNEGQRATPPAEMLRHHRYIIPTINGKDYLAKPPLLYWAIAGVYRLTGDVAPLTARIPAALSFVALVLCVYVFTRREAGENAARWSALAVMLSPYVIDRARYAELDVPLTLATFLAIMALRAACRPGPAAQSTRAVLLGGVALGAAILLKGPVPFLFLLGAWLALLLLANESQASWLRPGAYATGVAFALAVIMSVLSFLVPGAIRVPVALLLFLLVWTAVAWRFGGAARSRSLAMFLAICGMGILVAAPWALAVLATEGWPFVDRLIHSEVLERTHTATRINGGLPIYYLIGLLGMLVPWGLLLPCQLSKTSWQRGPSLYRFAILSGWLSVLIFSLIAGKEYEYVLPAVPLLCIGVGCQLAAVSDAAENWSARWMRIWRDAMIPFLGLLAIGFLVATFVKSPDLRIRALVFAAFAVAAGVYGWKHAPHRLPAIAAMTLAVLFLWTFSQDYRYTGNRSYKWIATVTGNLLRAGYEVEAVKMTAAYDVFPAFAYYAAADIPAAVDVQGVLAEMKGQPRDAIMMAIALKAGERVRSKLEGDQPYYCVLVEDQLTKANLPLREDFKKPLLGPYTTKNVVLIGNRPIPDPVWIGR